MSVDESAGDRGRRITDELVARGEARGFEVAREYPVQGGRLDVVWLLKPTPTLPGVDLPLPVVGFEVESSWRTRKHLKGDYLNLADLGASLGVIVLLGEGEDVEATRRFAERLVARPGPRVVVWSEHDVGQLARSTTVPPVEGFDVGAHPHDAATSDTVARHVGKYRDLWAWLRDQPAGQVTCTFDEIEEVIGMPLPASSRKHASHWSSYEGSAVVRAIHDAGWRTGDLNLSKETVTLTRGS